MKCIDKLSDDESQNGRCQTSKRVRNDLDKFKEKND